MLNVKKNDKVKILSGKDKGKIGTVINILCKTRQVIVSKINVITKHVKASNGHTGKLIKKEAPINISKVMIVCPQCKKSVRTKYNLTKKTRICRICGVNL
ncbi:MAG: 50S ribosomal protein L24 [Endomicrobium sp.]|jgi:large subunit ribosomal protein L24|nr:50S ribosomal protein L24 [Endomicrobium sp.]